MNRKLELGDAYNLGQPANHIKYYDEVAHSYDEEFVVEHKYIFPQFVGEHFLQLATRNDQPIADLGCGTGLVAETLGGKNLLIDGFDISSAMISKARGKNIYRQLQVADLTKTITNRIGTYGSLVSCGTFTLGHLGPQALKNCLGLAKPGGLCVIGINSLHFQKAGFEDFFAGCLREGKITRPNFKEVPIYEGNVGKDPIEIGNLVAFRIS